MTYIEKKIENVRAEISTLKQQLPYALNYSTNPYVLTKAQIKRKIKKLRYQLAMLEIEKSLPNFAKMTKAEIVAFLENDKRCTTLHYMPVFSTDEQIGAIMDDGKPILARYKLADGNDKVITYAYGVHVTPKIYGILKEKGF